jgi:hypothetical protein
VLNLILKQAVKLFVALMHRIKESSREGYNFVGFDNYFN